MKTFILSTCFKQTFFFLSKCDSSIDFHFNSFVFYIVYVCTLFVLSVRSVHHPPPFLLQFSLVLYDFLVACVSGATLHLLIRRIGRLYLLLNLN